MLQFHDPAICLASFSREYGELLLQIEHAGRIEGLGSAGVRVLLHLLTAPATAADTARSLGIDTGQLTRIRQSLDKKHLLDAHPSGSGRRLLTLSHQGVLLAKRIEDARSQAAHRFFEAMSGAERQRLIAGAASLGRCLEVAEDVVEVREGRPGDSGSIVARAVDSFCDGAPLSFKAREFAAALHRDLASCLAHDGLILVVQIQRVLAGAAIVEINSKRRTWHIRHIFMFRHMMGRGFGTKLLEGICARARRQGITELTASLPRSDFGEDFLARFDGWTLASAHERAMFGRRVVIQEWRLSLQSQ